VLTAFGVLLLLAEETRKALLRSRHRRRPRPGLPASTSLSAKEEPCTS